VLCDRSIKSLLIRYCKSRATFATCW